MNGENGANAPSRVARDLKPGHVTAITLSRNMEAILALEKVMKPSIATKHLVQVRILLV